MSGQLALMLGETLPPAAQAKVTIMLARLLAAVIEEARDE